MPRIKVKKFNKVPIIPIPKKFASKVDLQEDDAFLSSPKWREMEREADEDIKAGRVSPIFDTAEEAIKYLRPANGKKTQQARLGMHGSLKTTASPLKYKVKFMFCAELDTIS